MKPNDQDAESKPGFLKFMRSPESLELLRDALAFALLALIAFRARWRSAFSADGLEIGEAFIGDYQNYGLTRRKYRTLVARLVKWGFITVRTTRKGTIAKLISTAVFDINSWPNECLTSEQNAKNRPSQRPTVLPVKNRTERPTERPASGQQEANRRPLTNKEIRKEINNVAAVRAREAATGAPEAAAATTEGFEGKERQAELEKIARAAGNDPAQLCKALAPHFSDIDAKRELSAYTKWMKKKNLRATARGFVRWLLRAEPAIKPPPRKASRNGATAPPPPPKVSDAERDRIFAAFKEANRAAGLHKGEQPF